MEIKFTIIKQTKKLHTHRVTHTVLYIKYTTQDMENLEASEILFITPNRKTKRIYGSKILNHVRKQNKKEKKKTSARYNANQLNETKQHKVPPKQL